jgi:hypothetical protein
MKLQQQVEYWKAHAQHLEQTIADLERYARLDKFAGVNNGINRDDILHRTNESRQAMITSLFEDFGEYRQAETQGELAL